MYTVKIRMRYDNWCITGDTMSNKHMGGCLMPQIWTADLYKKKIEFFKMHFQYSVWIKILFNAFLTVEYVW
jgi:hypothetical protein